MSEDRGDRIRRPRGRKPRRKVCAFCVDKVQHIDYKDVMRLRRFTSELGKIRRNIAGEQQRPFQGDHPTLRVQHLLLLFAETAKRLNRLLLHRCSIFADS